MSCDFEIWPEVSLSRDMRIILTLALCAFATACVHKGEKFKDGDTWVVRSTFVMKCKINADGSWFTKVIGCKTLGGVVVEPGRVVSEGATTYECSTMKDGRVEIKRTYQNNKRQTSCEGHNIGESWVTQHNFRKMCTEDGARITECLTDAGISVPLNQNLVLSGIVYTCTRYPNGTVSINREGLPAPTNFKNNVRKAQRIFYFARSREHDWEHFKLVPLSFPFLEISEEQARFASETSRGAGPNVEKIPGTRTRNSMACYNGDDSSVSVAVASRASRLSHTLQSALNVCQ
ncbi:hypothetical protein Y032_0114g451 [Ancylostoma ceylanicum]|uniref:Abnormal cell migration protein 18-like fibronectin type I domain-containing protein n=1 Tax=Ancylostoma ceylanicum TaxID=53326 RepID=A0A016TCG8_9BILA|nr:hypothetical protein Y032_0114g451 [Ancylostoma ceylanicum]